MANYSFGDSITTGAGASNPGTKGYIALLNAALGSTIVNSSVSTSMVMDQANAVYSKNTIEGDKSILAFGTNDQAKYDVSSVKMGYFTEGLRAYALWLGSKIKLANQANGVVFTGSWGGGYAFNSLASGVPGSKASFSITGTKFAITMIRQYGNTSMFKVKVDGVDKGTFSSGGDVRTLLGRAYGPMCIQFTGLSAGAHNVVIEVVTASASSVVFFHWFTMFEPKSKVVIANVPKAKAYTYGGSESNVNTYNQAISSLVGELVAQGIDASLANVSAVIGQSDFGDNVHPNDNGHIKYKDVMLAALNGGAVVPTVPSLTLSETKIYLGSDNHLYAYINGSPVQIY
jgi:hypothetical protein